MLGLSGGIYGGGFGKGCSDWGAGKTFLSRCSFSWLRSSRRFRRRAVSLGFPGAGTILANREAGWAQGCPWPNGPPVGMVGAGPGFLGIVDKGGSSKDRDRDGEEGRGPPGALRGAGSDWGSTDPPGGS